MDGIYWVFLWVGNKGNDVFIVMVVRVFVSGLNFIRVFAFFLGVFCFNFCLLVLGDRVRVNL